MVFTETQEQTLLFEWAEYQAGTYPELRWMFHVGNGGKRDIITAVQLKRMGVKSGVPDVFLPIQRQGFAGLFIEMKRLKGGAVSINQKEWINGLKANGYRVEVCKGFEAARDTIINYLEGKE